MNVLITGGTGFIGTALQNYILSQGGTVHYLTKKSNKIVTTTHVKGFLWDTTNKYIDPKAFEGIDCIVNLAGKSINCPWTTKNKNAILSSRINASQTLFEYLEKNNHSIRQIVHASAIGIYPSSINRCYTEDETHINPEFLGKVCKNWEAENRKFETLDITNTFIRIGMVLSKDGGALPEMTNLVKKGIGKKMGSGKQMYSWIHREDLIRMIYFLLHKKLGGIFNAVSSQPITQQKLNTSLADHFNKSFIVPKIPEFLFKTVLGERSALILDSQKVSSEKISNKGFVFDFLDIHSALINIYK